MNIENHIKITSVSGLEAFEKSILSGTKFASSFVFCPGELFSHLLDTLGIKYDIFYEKFLYYDEARQLHISQSSEGFIWISTIGLVGAAKITNNHFCNAFESQAQTLTTLIKATIEIIDEGTVYNIDSFYYESLSQLSRALFQNIIFFYELFGKAYLSISGISIPQSHKLKTVFDAVCDAMFELHHNNSMFHALLLPSFKAYVNHINALPSGFKEQYVKYDDNPMDNTIISVSDLYLNELLNTVNLYRDFILDYYFRPNKCDKLHQGFYENLIEIAKTPEQISRVKQNYGFLLNENYY